MSNLRVPGFKPNSRLSNISLLYVKSVLTCKKLLRHAYLAIAQLP